MISWQNSSIKPEIVSYRSLSRKRNDSNILSLRFKNIVFSKVFGIRFHRKCLTNYSSKAVGVGTRASYYDKKWSC